MFGTTVEYWGVRWGVVAAAGGSIDGDDSDLYSAERLLNQRVRVDDIRLKSNSQDETDLKETRGLQAPDAAGCNLWALRWEGGNLFGVR